MLSYFWQEFSQNIVMMLLVAKKLWKAMHEKACKTEHILFKKQLIQNKSENNFCQQYISNTISMNKGHCSKTSGDNILFGFGECIQHNNTLTYENQ